jgi:hypothetical protein
MHFYYIFTANLIHGQKMKSNIKLIGVALLLFASCKKDSDAIPTHPVKPVPIDYTIDNPDGMQIKVENLTDKTSISITVTNYYVVKDTLLAFTNLSGNKTYSTKNVTSGSKLNVHVSANVKYDIDGNGSATISFYYKGSYRGSASGNIGYTDGSDVPVTIP